jgi:hypothetical protein
LWSTGGWGTSCSRVEKVGFSSKQQEDGSYLNVWTLTSGPTADGGPPWVIELPADAHPRLLRGAEPPDSPRDDEAPRCG